MKGIISLPISAKAKAVLAFAVTVLVAIVQVVGDGELNLQEIVTIVLGLLGAGGVFAVENKPPAPGSGYRV
jgi:hypothetical protein